MDPTRAESATGTAGGRPESATGTAGGIPRRSGGCPGHATRTSVALRQTRRQIPAPPATFADLSKLGRDQSRQSFYNRLQPQTGFSRVKWKG
jgi:hypothetical protein